MNRPYDTVCSSDVEQNETLRQSELVSRLTVRIESDLCACGVVQVERTVSRAISQWLLDNNLRITSIN